MENECHRQPLKVEHKADFLNPKLSDIGQVTPQLWCNPGGHEAELDASPFLSVCFALLLSV